MRRYILPWTRSLPPVNPMAHNEYPTITRVDTFHEDLAPLSDQEIDKFIGELDVDKDGNVSFKELEKRLEDVLKELAPDPQEHHLNHPNRRRRDRKVHTNPQDPEKGEVHHTEHDGLHAFLCSLMPDCDHTAIPKEEFRQRVKSWNIPSQKQNSAEDEQEQAKDLKKNLTLYRKGRALWSIRGPRILFACFVGAMILAFGLWQLMEYVNKPDVRRALGWGVIMAKGFAGTLYPILFFMLLSMSRWFATACRRFYHLSRFIDWDRHQSFHIWMACLGLFAATMHAIGHLTGTFLYGSRPAQQDDLAAILGPDAVPRPYSRFVRSLPGWSGIVSLGLFWLIALSSEPHVRKWSYELFQGGHLLMFPMIGLLSAHGTAKLLQFPMLGFWLVGPALLVIGERLHRVYRGFIKLPATCEELDKDTMTITCRKPGGKPWRYSAGQYVFLQVPAVSFFQWHPFTVSHCAGDVLQLHIKKDGDWTRKLAELPHEINIGIDGPFGAAAQRFYEYDRSLIIGAGVGVTPFSAIISDLEQSIFEEDGWERQSRRWSMRRSSRAPSTSQSRRSSRAQSQKRTPSTERGEPAILAASSSEVKPGMKIPCEQRVDFHWIVKEKNSLLWFSDLLNRAHDLERSLPPGKLDLNIHTHITLKRTNISEHIFRYLLDAYRTETCPVSALTGLKMRSQFGRPDFEKILEAYHEDVRKEIESGYIEKGMRIAVFFCGAPAIGEILSDMCHELTIRGRGDDSQVRWDFRMEVFG